MISLLIRVYLYSCSYSCPACKLGHASQNVASACWDTQLHTKLLWSRSAAVGVRVARKTGLPGTLRTVPFPRLLHYRAPHVHKTSADGE